MNMKPSPASWQRVRRPLTLLVAAGLAFGVLSSAAVAGHTKTPPPPPPPPPPPATPATYSGDAQVVGVDLHVLSMNLLGLKLDLPIALELGHAGPLPSTGGYLSSDLLTVGDPSPVQLLLTANAVHALTTGNGFEAFSQAYIADVNLGVGPVLPTLLAIKATVLESNAQATCKGTGGAAVSGSSQIAGLSINGAPIVVTGAPNQTIDLSPIAKIVINEQIQATTGSTGSITVNALHVYVLPPGGPLSLAGVLTGDVIISRAHADIGNCSVAPPSCESTNTCPTCESMGTCPPCEVDDFITGGGQAYGGKVSFSTHGGKKGTQFRNGHLNVVDKANSQKINTGDLFGYRDPTPTSTTRELNFYCGAGNGVCTVTETDKGEPGTNDRWFMDAHGYSAGSLTSAISSGNIQLHEPRGCKDKSGGSAGGGTRPPKGNK